MNDPIWAGAEMGKLKVGLFGDCILCKLEGASGLCYHEGMATLIVTFPSGWDGEKYALLRRRLIVEHDCKVNLEPMAAGVRVWGRDSDLIAVKLYVEDFEVTYCP